MLKKMITLTIIIAFTLTFLQNCDTTGPPDITKVANTINLTVEWQDQHRIALKWNKSGKDEQNNFTYTLKRKTQNGSEFTKIFTLIGSDTVYIDDNEGDSLEIGSSYTYKVEAYNTADELIDTSKTISTATLSPTSHDIVWGIDTLGQPGDYLYDVWGLDENNVWAVGGIETDEGRTAIIKWNGQKWNYHSWPEGAVYSIFGFSETDIWVVGEWSNRGFLGHFDGSNWTEYKSNYFYEKGDTVYSLRAVWGSSPEDVWAVGLFGSIIHWDGEEWTKISIDNSFKEYQFSDIWGFSDKNIYVAGRIFHKEAALLQFNGSQWNIIIKQQSLASFATIWGANSSKLFFIEYGNYIIENGKISKFLLQGRTSGIEKIRGSGSNNIFTVGHFGQMFHNDGLEWYRIDNISNEFTESSALNGCYVTDKEIFAVGITPIGCIIIHGKIQ